MDLRTDSDLAVYVINGLVFITVVESVYSAVRTDALHKADYVLSLKCEIYILVFYTSTFSNA
jgi:hypothetical protein